MPMSWYYMHRCNYVYLWEENMSFVMYIVLYWISQVQIRNRSCSYFHAYCIPCIGYLKSCAQAEESPYLKPDCIQDQIECPEVICTSQTSVKCLDAMIETINGETFEVSSWNSRKYNNQWYSTQSININLKI